MEIRNKVTNYVAKKIWASKKENPGKVRITQYLNIAVLRANTMKTMANFFGKESLEKLFFCFPDPNFKKSHYRRRIINENLLGDYVYLLKSGGKIYTITDVLQLHEWHLSQLSKHPLLSIVCEEDCEKDPCIAVMLDQTEEGKKVTRNRGKKFWCVFQKH
jgi:Predicted S-adenosylmethionine-dependent methyltransferase